MEEIEKVDLFWAKHGSDWMIAGSLGTSLLLGVNYTTSQVVNKEFEGRKLLAIDSIATTQELCVLTEQNVKSAETNEVIKQVAILKFTDGIFTEIDQLNVFPQATSLTALGKSSYLVVEGKWRVTWGNQYFNLLATNDTKLTAEIVNGLYASNKSEAEEPTNGGGEQPSTKGNTDGTPPALDDISPQGSGKKTPREADHTSGIHHLIDQRISSGPTKYGSNSPGPVMDQEKVIKLIDERLLLYKDQLKKELTAEIKEQLLQELRGETKKEIEFRRSRPNSKSKDQKPKPYAIKISDYDN